MTSPLIATDPVLPVPIVDTREPELTAWRFPVPARRQALDVADYTCAGHEHELRIERKAWGDALSCATVERDRFERMLAKLQAFPFRYLIVEGDWSDVFGGHWSHTGLKPLAFEGTLHAWQQRHGVHLVMAGNAANAARVAWGVMRRVVLDAHKRERQATTARGGA